MKTLIIVLASIMNLTWAPDSSRFAFTQDNDLYVCAKGSSDTLRLTHDGSDLILNGYASWGYYEEIFGRASNYRAFWWSPDSRKLAFYRFDQTQVPMFPIYSAIGQDGVLYETRYPKVGETNPKVRIGMIDMDRPSDTVWADFDENEDQYFGLPFWGDDGRYLYVQREPRVQQHLDLFRVDSSDGSKVCTYSEDSATWLSWIEGMLFADKGLYMVRDFETGWEQIYYLSYDGAVLRALTEGPNWRVQLQGFDSRKKNIFFTAQRDSHVRSTLYRLDRKGRVTAMSPLEYNVDRVTIAEDFKSAELRLSNLQTPPFDYNVSFVGKGAAEASAASALLRNPLRENAPAADASAAPGRKNAAAALPEIVCIKAADGQEMYGSILYPSDFDPAARYPVHFEIYGGPNTAYVTDRWRRPDSWWGENDIIHIVADCRAAGHTGRAGRDLVFRDLTSVPVKDFVTWAEWVESLPYVDGKRIGVEGFSFGGTMTAMLLMRHPEHFCCGIAGGGVYDWELYDSHYTERFMLTPYLNHDGFEISKVLNYADMLQDGVHLKLTHGTGDDNVHFQNTLKLVDALQEAGKQFELMIYPDGMHGYRGRQGEHSREADHVFWLKYLKNQ